MTRLASIHETTRYEVIIRGVRSRAEAEAIVLAVERLPAAGAWQPTDAPAITADDLPPHALSDSDDAAPEPMDRDEAVSR